MAHFKIGDLIFSDVDQYEIILEAFDDELEEGLLIFSVDRNLIYECPSHFLNLDFKNEKTHIVE